MLLHYTSQMRNSTIVLGLVASLSSFHCAADDLAKVEKLDCTSAAATALVDVSSGNIRGQIRGKAFHNSTIQVVEIVPDYPTEATDAIGGATVGRLGVGQIYLAFSKAKRSDLGSLEDVQLFHLDSDANLRSYPVSCRVTFAP